MNKLIILFLLLLVPVWKIFAGPFDVMDKYYPDYIVSNIWQDNSSKDIYVKICNIWWSMNDYGNMAIGVKKSDWKKYWKIFQNIKLNSGACSDYRAFTPSWIWIVNNGNYTLAVWVLIKSSKTEKNKTNNIRKFNTYISTYIAPTYNYYNTNYNNYYDSNYNQYYNQNINITYPSGWKNFSNYSNNYINLKASVYANSTNIRNINIYFIRQSTGEQYWYERIDNVSYSYWNYNPFEINKTFYINGWPTWDYYVKIEAYNYNGNIIASDMTRTFSISDSYYNNNYYNNYGNYRSSDLVVREVWQDTSNNRIYAKICNIWANMSSSSYIRTDFTYNGKTIQKYININLNRDSCVSDFYVNLWEFNQNNNYYDNNISVKIDVDNTLSESNENNNYFNQYINTSWSRWDLVVDNITQDKNNRKLNIKICNRGNGVLNNQNWSTRISNIEWYPVIRNHSINLWQNSCIDFDVSYYEFGVDYREYGYREIKIETDIYNNIYETNEDNNSFIRGFYFN